MISILNSLTVAEKFVLYAFQIGGIELISNGRELKSGRISPYFFNSGLFNSGRDLVALASACVSAIKQIPKKHLKGYKIMDYFEIIEE